ncbi:MAG: hypothetical protein JKY63_07640 [Rhodobiaceae bacterium]|nr:hypothetical protein [Rhodobiaceae bacterium]
MLEFGLVFDKNFGDLLGVIIKRVRFIRLGILQLVLCVRNRRQHCPRRPVRRLQTHILQHPLHRCHLIRTVVNRVVGFEPWDICPLGVSAKQPGAQAMESSNRQSAHPRIQSLFDYFTICAALFWGLGATDLNRHTLSHFAGGLIGKGQCQNAPRRCALFDDLRDPTRDDPRLARASSSQDQQRAFRMKHCLLLCIGEPIGDGIALRCRFWMMFRLRLFLRWRHEVGDLIDGYFAIRPIIRRIGGVVIGRFVAVIEGDLVHRVEG